MYENIRHPNYYAGSGRQAMLRQLSTLLVDDGETNRQARLLREPHFRLPASMEGIDDQHSRGLDRPFLRGHATDDWLRSHHNVPVTSYRSGKTNLACTLGNSTCRPGVCVRYDRIPRLIAQMTSTGGERKLPPDPGCLSPA